MERRSISIRKEEIEGCYGYCLFRVIMVIVMIGIAAYVIAKPYIPQLPFKKGDIIQSGGANGKVDLVTVMHTRIRTFDGKVI